MTQRQPRITNTKNLKHLAKRVAQGTAAVGIPLLAGVYGLSQLLAQPAIHASDLSSIKSYSMANPGYR